MHGFFLLCIVWGPLGSHGHPDFFKNPWSSTTLEWTAEVKHIHGNWDGPIPEVHRWPYDYSKLNKDESDYVIAGQDFVPQNIPMRDNEEEMDH